MHAHIHTHAYTCNDHTYMDAGIYTYIHIYAHTHTHTHTHTHARTHTHTHWKSASSSRLTILTSSYSGSPSGKAIVTAPRRQSRHSWKYCFVTFWFLATCSLALTTFLASLICWDSYRHAQICWERCAQIQNSIKTRAMCLWATDP